MDPKTTNGKNVLALSWNIATEPKLYRELAPNPYSPAALQIISERFLNSSTDDVIRAVVFAESEGKYDRNFKQLPKELQEAEFYKQTNETSEITRRLNDYYSQHALKFAELSEDLIYDILFKNAFGITGLQEVEQRYAQNQRKHIKLLILNLISEAQSLRLRVKQESQILISEGNSLLIQNNVPETQFVVPKPKKTFSKIAFALLSIISFFYLTFIFIEKGLPIVLEKQSLVASATNQVVHEQVLSAEAQRKNPTLPVHLIIPSINVDAAVQDIGLTEQGAMDVPDNTTDVGWYKLGSLPGETGSAVISGHFDGREGNFGVFNNLNKLKPGDKIYVLNDQGTTTTFAVRESRTYNPGYADEVFFPNDNGVHLNLVTCDGVWDKNKKSYSKRLVVFTDITH